mmetsp:Transcript_35294/g.52484  ORF Transcript_35294/g.52484 Transcript_35294/m.52484 type:complete len:107 (-) Transcript_35294:124-444(-)
MLQSMKIKFTATQEAPSTSPQREMLQVQVRWWWFKMILAITAPDDAIFSCLSCFTKPLAEYSCPSSLRPPCVQFRSVKVGFSDVQRAFSALNLEHVHLPTCPRNPK